MPSGKFVAYYRVSTARQGRSGLGLDGQKHAVADYLRGGRCTLVAEFVEVESGRKADRAELRRALTVCRLHKATLIVAKFDRLSRNAAFLLRLRDSTVECVAVDMPDANRLTVGIMAMIAEQEAEAISARTKAALTEAKLHGVKLGNPAHLNQQARLKGATASARARGAKAEERAIDLAPIVAELRKDGAVSLREVAAGLNALGIPTAHGAAWSATQVQRLINRIDATED